MTILTRAIFARKLFDISWRSIFRGICAVIASRDNDHISEKNITNRLDQIWAPSQTMTSFSVRSGFDLLLQACAFPAGSEIILSAVTVPDMVNIIRLHNLVPVPVDLQATDASVSAKDVAEHITSRTKAVLVAQLFGNRHPLANLGILAREHQLLLIEDCAQAFKGRDFVGSLEASISMFSFGPIKTCTALGGALLTVRDPKLLQSMKSTLATYPQQKRTQYLKKLLKYSIFKAVTDNRYAYGTLIALLRAREGDHHAAITNLSHSLPGNANLVSQIRLRPSNASMQLLEHRISTFNSSYIDKRAARIAELVVQLPETLQPIGFKMAKGLPSTHHYWICPIRTIHPRQVLNDLLDAGFDAAAGNASLTVVNGPSTSENEAADACVNSNFCPTASMMMRDVIYLPVDHVFTPKSKDRLRAVLIRHTGPT